MILHKILKLLLVLILMSAPLQQSIASAFADTHHHDATPAAGHAEAGAVHAHAGAATHSDHGDAHQAGHNHAACGAQCFVALISIYSLPTPALAMPHSSLFIPVTGIVLPTDSKPPRYL